MMTLNISNNPGSIETKMISTMNEIPSCTIVSSCGTVEATVERALGKTVVDGIGTKDFEVLADMVASAKHSIAVSARVVGADAVVGFRYELARQDRIFSLLAYGTAVKIQKRA